MSVRRVRRPDDERRRRLPVGMVYPASMDGSSIIAHHPPWVRTQSLSRLESAETGLGPQELRRRIWHFAPGVLALIGASIPHRVSFETPLLIVMTLAALGTVIVASCCETSIRRPGEQNCRAAILGYGLSVIPLFLLFPAHLELALTVAGIIAFGDGSATVVGLLAGNRKLPWNQKKSWAGSAAFLLVAIPLATSIYWSASVPHVPRQTALLCVVPTVVVTAAAESLPQDFNDNLIVGTTAALTIIAMQWLLRGAL